MYVYITHLLPDVLKPADFCSGLLIWLIRVVWLATWYIYHVASRNRLLYRQP